jgi:hypothetical protein
MHRVLALRYVYFLEFRTWAFFSIYLSILYAAAQDKVLSFVPCLIISVFT